MVDYALLTVDDLRHIMASARKFIESPSSTTELEDAINILCGAQNEYNRKMQVGVTINLDIKPGY
jgi:hypothetical protein